MCRERLHILSFSGDNVCRVRQNVLLRVHILSPATNCAGATKCAVTRLFQVCDIKQQEAKHKDCKQTFSTRILVLDFNCVSYEI